VNGSQDTACKAKTNSPPPSGSHFDIIVVGGDNVGLSAAYYAISGRGFKFTSLVGRLLVDLATAGSTGYDVPRPDLTPWHHQIRNDLRHCSFERSFSQQYAGQITVSMPWKFS
jgi:hypothetical protein